MAAYPLRQLNAKLSKTVTVATSEIEQDESDNCKGMYVFRDNDGAKFLWSPRPYRYENHNVETVAEADQIMFLCPACFAKNGGASGTHSVLVTFAGRNVPDEAGSRDAEGNPSRWNASGTTIDDLSLTPSILLDAKREQEDGCHWHGFVGSSGIPVGHAG
jgi:hypothetical protein